MNLALKLHPTYGSLVDTHIDLGTIWAYAPIEIRTRAQEDRLQIHKKIGGSGGSRCRGFRIARRAESLK